jgi:hypothetical protein
MVRLRSNVIREIQRLISVACLSALPDRPCGSLKKADLEDELFRLFHGTAAGGNPPNDNGNKIAYDDSTDQTCANEALAPGDSFVSMFFEGRNQFASAFDVEQHATHIRYGPDGRVDIAATCSNTTTRRHLLPQLVASRRKKSEITWKALREITSTTATFCSVAEEESCQSGI